MVYSRCCTGVVLPLPNEHAMMRLLMSLLLSIFFLVAVTVLQPYRRTDNNTIATAAQLAMCSSLLLAIFIKAHGDMVSELRNIVNGEVLPLCPFSLCPCARSRPCSCPSHCPCPCLFS